MMKFKGNADNCRTDRDKDFVVRTIINVARTGEKGSFGDGKILSRLLPKSTLSVQESKRLLIQNRRRLLYEGSYCNNSDEQNQRNQKSSVKCRY